MIGMVFYELTYITNHNLCLAYTVTWPLSLVVVLIGCLVSILYILGLPYYVSAPKQQPWSPSREDTICCTEEVFHKRL